MVEFLLVTLAELIIGTVVGYVFELSLVITLKPPLDSPNHRLNSIILSMSLGNPRVSLIDSM